MKWKVECKEAPCGAEIYEAETKEEALKIACKEFSHDRIPHSSTSNTAHLFKVTVENRE